MTKTKVKAVEWTESQLQKKGQHIAQREVICCLSYMIATLAAGMGESLGNRDLRDLCEQAAELCYPAQDWEESALQGGWKQHKDGTWRKKGEANQESAQAACDNDGLDPYEWEVYEHWAVSNWLAEKLTEAGERVDSDIGGLNVWARTTTGQSIYMDSVFKGIARKMLDEYGE